MYKKNAIEIKRGIDFKSLGPAALSLSFPESDAATTSAVYNKAVILTTAFDADDSAKFVPLSDYIAHVTGAGSSSSASEIIARSADQLYVVYEGAEESHNFYFKPDPFAFQLKQIYAELEINAIYEDSGNASITPETTFTAIKNQLSNAEREVFLAVDKDGNFLTVSANVLENETNLSYFADKPKVTAVDGAAANELNFGDRKVSVDDVYVLGNVIVTNIKKRTVVPETDNPDTRRREIQYIVEIVAY